MPLAKATSTTGFISGSTSLTINSYTTTSGNLLVAFVGTNQTSSSTQVPSGWTLISQQEASGSTQSLTVVSRQSAGGTLNYTFTVSTGGAGALIAAQIIEVSGANGKNVNDYFSPTASTVFTNTGASATSLSLGSINSSREGYALGGIYWVGGAVSAVGISASTPGWDTPLTTSTIRLGTTGKSNSGGALTGPIFTWTTSRSSVGTLLALQDPTKLHVYVSDTTTVGDNLSDSIINPLLLRIQQRVRVTDLPNYFSEIVLVGERVQIIIRPLLSEFFAWFG